jgi:hypothetical protein
VLDVYDVDGHVRQSLSLYVMGALLDDNADEVEAHLDQCQTCRNELRGLQNVTFALALVSAEEAEELARVTLMEDELAGEDPDRPAGLSDSGGPARPAAPRPARPANRRPGGSRPGLRSRLGGHARTVVLAAAFALVIGFAAGVYLKVTNSTPPIATAAAYADDQVSGVSLSANASGRADKVSIHASISGLAPGVSYYLFVVTTDGAAHQVRQWSSEDGSQTIDQDVNVGIDSLAYFTVVKADGTVVMLAWCRPAPTPTG